MDRWIDGFAQGMTCFDSDAKDVVKITNGKCQKPHGGTGLEHTGLPYDGHMSDGTGCLYAPSEAIALRVMGVTHNGDPVIAFTYRKVRPEALSPIKGSPENAPDVIFGKVRRSRRIGRV